MARRVHSYSAKETHPPPHLPIPALACVSEHRAYAREKIAPPLRFFHQGPLLSTMVTRARVIWQKSARLRSSACALLGRIVSEGCIAQVLAVGPRRSVFAGACERDQRGVLARGGAARQRRRPEQPVPWWTRTPDRLAAPRHQAQLCVQVSGGGRGRGRVRVRVWVRV